MKLTKTKHVKWAKKNMWMINGRGSLVFRFLELLRDVFGPRQRSPHSCGPCLYKHTGGGDLAITHVFIVVEAHVGPFPVPGVPGQLA